MSIIKLQSEGLNLADTFAFTGTVSGTVSGSDSFHAHGNADAWANVSAGTIIQFADDSSGDSFDTGSRYSTSTYKYTARATGVYLFYYSIYTSENDNDNAFSFLKNSGIFVLLYSCKIRYCDFTAIFSQIEVIISLSMCRSS